MDASFTLFLGRHTLETALLLSAPILLTCIIVGVTVTLFQAVTSIRDMTLTIVPKLMAVGAVTLIFGGWMLEVTLRFTTEIFSYIQNVRAEMRHVVWPGHKKTLELVGVIILVSAITGIIVSLFDTGFTTLVSQFVVH